MFSTVLVPHAIKSPSRPGVPAVVAQSPGRRPYSTRKKRAWGSLFLSLALALLYGDGLASRCFGQSAPIPTVRNLPAGFRAPVSYRMEARLLPKDNLIKGTAFIQWTNYSPAPVDRLPFHLYMNAFEGTASTFFQEERLETGEAPSGPSAPGGVVIRRIEVGGSGNIIKSLRFIQPDDGNASDRTVAELVLPQAVEAGRSVQIAVYFETKLPPVVMRAGRFGNFFMAGQWYPKLGVLEPPGWRHSGATRWNCHQYHYNSEFYANFANYEVRITVPANFIVGATGKEVFCKPVNGRKEKVYLYKQDAAVDFAWSASPDFVEVAGMFSGSSDVSPDEYASWAAALGLDPGTAKLPDVGIRLLLQKDHEDYGPLFMRTLKDAIKMYGLLFGPYPYATVTVIDPPSGALEAGGMEYPTLFTNAFHRVMKWWPFDTLGMESVITHEFGHNYWMATAASNEFEEPWIDEGLNQYSENRINSFLAGLGNQPMDHFSASSFLASRFHMLGNQPLLDSLATWSWKFAPGTYFSQSYSRAAMVMLTLENLMGRNMFLRTLRQFYQTFRFAHPDTRDFQDLFSAAGGHKVRLFLKQAFAPGATVDYSVSTVTSGRTGAAEPWDNHFTLYRKGTITLPVEVEVRFESGETRRLVWDGASPWQRFDLKGSSPVVSVCVDPGRKVPLDTCFANNSTTTRPAKENISKLQAIVQFVFQLLLQLLLLVF